ncbi:MAG: phosphoesterase [Lachnospiraceae bacterium]|nr:phosphoesterase [Lachnospiraceae bacterium]
MIFFIADTHFGDQRILRYENRPFESAQAMDEELARRWNETVTPEDTVYVLGDWGIFSPALLNGEKYLVKGNHDTLSSQAYRDMGFAEVYDLPVILEDFWILSHQPLYVCENMPYANLFGHVHASPLYRTFSSQHYCVSVERTGYAPVSFEEIRHRIQG